MHKTTTNTTWPALMYSINVCICEWPMYDIHVWCMYVPCSWLL